ncbi:MAG TPA: DEAD/DEAH box helicase [Hyphomicrobiaceae bacterium]|nr:DEAD/DEAH box helicase [Hyphomicrobiaceae bacterium]
MAATFHDLGKLDPDNQAALNQGRGGKLPWDHIDAGVAHLRASGNWMAAWLVRAHHSPGLPCLAKHFDPDGLGLRLRGLRHEDCERSEHCRQIERTNGRLSQYLADHEAAVGRTAIAPAKPSHGLSMRLALSCLVDADYSDTAAFDRGVAPGEPIAVRWQDRLHRLDAYVEDLGRKGGGARDTARAAFYWAARDANISDAFACCEAPVGLGKTTAITAFLLKSALENNLRRLFIVAPYTNIIDQTVRVLREALSLPGENPQDVVVAHHHKADFSSRLDRDVAVLWRAPIVVTTSVQFFETLAACGPSELRKLHELPGSAVFLDEAHAALPVPLWPQNWRWLRELADKWSCRFVFASGSLAKFWENPQVIDPPAAVPEIMPSNLGAAAVSSERNRIRYVTEGLIGSPKELIERVECEPGPRLVILNTVQSAAVLAQKMRDAGKDVLHVSTALCPKDRAPIVNRIVERLTKRGDKNWTVVATSCLEAGLDLSFRTGFRERFSTANLIQTGGRVNRNGEYSDQGPATVFDFILETVDGITRHPGARDPGEVLKRQFARGDFCRMSPACLVSAAMAEELKNRPAQDQLTEAEKKKDYPKVAQYGRVIQADTRVVVVDSNLVARIRSGERLSFQEILMGSVQLWAERIEALGLTAFPERRELYKWPHEYDNFIGYMAGVLKSELLKAEVI